MICQIPSNAATGFHSAHATLSQQLRSFNTRQKKHNNQINSAVEIVRKCGNVQRLKSPLLTGSNTEQSENRKEQEQKFCQNALNSHLTCDQALTSTRGYPLPDFLNNYPYPTRKILLPDRVVGSKKHPICPIIGKS